jgi:2-methylisocitrate lyase-like PEP mutase family enzyme
MSAENGLRSRLASAPALLAPGVFDALSAAMAEEAGFEAAYLSGASIAYTLLGRSDIGLVSMTEVAGVMARIRERVSLPVIIDADTGWGNALNVERTVRVFERAGASVIQLEDQTYPKRCGHLRDKSLIGAGEMAGKIKAAVDTRDAALIMARTDAIAVEGFEAALERAERYLEAGADILFIEAPENCAQMAALCDRFAARVPLLANMVEGGRTPLANTADLSALGYRIVIFPGGLVRALAWTAREYFASLKAQGSTELFRNRMFDFQGLQALLGTEATLARGKAYEGRD